MFTISDSIFINAPIERCFLLSTNIELVGRTYGMKPIEGKLSGMFVAEDRLVWAGWKFGFPQMNDRTVLNDKIRFTMPLGFVGHVVGKFVLVPYLSKRLRRRLALLKRVAENRKEWEKYLPEETNVIRHVGGSR